jgi:hypothetical protein
MSGLLTVAEVTLQLDGWYAALTALMRGQEYTIGGIRNGRQLKRADLPEVRNTIDWLKGELAEATARESGGTGIKIKRLVV